MSSSDVPADVRALIRAHLGSVDHVEVLLCVARSPAERLTPRDVAQALRIDEKTVGGCLANLAAAGVIVVSDAGYGLGAITAELRATLDRLATLYDERPLSLVREVLSRPSRLFADAFRIRRTD